MKQETLAALPEGNSNHIYEAGKLSAEVKILKTSMDQRITANEQNLVTHSHL